MGHLRCPQAHENAPNFHPRPHPALGYSPGPPRRNRPPLWTPQEASCQAAGGPGRQPHGGRRAAGPGQPPHARHAPRGRPRGTPRGNRPPRRTRDCTRGQQARARAVGAYLSHTLTELKEGKSFLSFPLPKNPPKKKKKKTISYHFWRGPNSWRSDSWHERLWRARGTGAPGRAIP